MRVNIIVGISDARVSANPDDVLATYSLGSCIGVAVQDPITKVAGLLHFQLPTATADPTRAGERPCMYADSGMAALLAEIARHGGVQRRLRIRIAGGAQMLNDANFFDIGRRNHAAIRKVLWKLGLLLESEHIGGNAPRSIFMRVADGSLTIKSNGQEIAA